MKKNLLLIAVILLSFNLFAQETEADVDGTKIELSQQTKEEKKAAAAAKRAERDAKEYSFKFRINEGASFGQITRVEQIEDRSNFVRETMITGAFCNFQTVDLYDWFDITCQLGAYYPVRYAFNGMQQFPKNKLSYAVDGFLGLTYSYAKFNEWIPIDLSVGMHSMYQLTDEYHMVYIGFGFLGTLNFPLTKNWTIVNNYFFSIDDPNMGTNKVVQPFTVAYQYHIDLGFSFSRRAKNSYYYIAKK